MKFLDILFYVKSLSIFSNFHKNRELLPLSNTHSRINSRILASPVIEERYAEKRSDEKIVNMCLYSLRKQNILFEMDEPNVTAIQENQRKAFSKDKWTHSNDGTVHYPETQTGFQQNTLKTDCGIPPQVMTEQKEIREKWKITDWNVDVIYWLLV